MYIGEVVWFCLLVLCGGDTNYNVKPFTFLHLILAPFGIVSSLHCLQICEKINDILIYIFKQCSANVYSLSSSRIYMKNAFFPYLNVD